MRAFKFERGQAVRIVSLGVAAFVEQRDWRSWRPVLYRLAAFDGDVPKVWWREKDLEAIGEDSESTPEGVTSASFKGGR